MISGIESIWRQFQYFLTSNDLDDGTEYSPYSGKSIASRSEADNPSSLLGTRQTHLKQQVHFWAPQDKKRTGITAVRQEQGCKVDEGAGVTFT